MACVYQSANTNMTNVDDPLVIILGHTLYQGIDRTEPEPNLKK